MSDPLTDPDLQGRGVDVDVLIVGAGISGIGAAIELLRRGRRSVVLLERAERLGGTWRDNTYPGIAVDIPSSSYSFAFETDYPWSRSYARGAEIQAYVELCARKYGVTRHIRYRSEVVRAELVEERRWRTVLSDGTAITSRYLIAATGLFTTPTLPDIPGLSDFAGVAFHSARWRHDHDLTGRRVAIIGTGASAVQIIPEIAQRTAHLTVFQRTPIWISPRLDYPLPAGAWYDPRRLSVVRSIERFFSELTIEVLTLATAVYARFPLLVRAVQGLVRLWMARQVKDPTVREKLLPSYTLGCKRPTPSNTYLRTFSRDDVALITTPIARIEPEGVVTEDGVLHACDTLVLATGFLTTQRGNNPAFAVHGRDGVELGALWESERLQCYRGVAVPGYPNFFLTAGPYSGGFNWFTMLSAHLDQIIACIEEADARGASRVEVSAGAHAAWMAQMWRHAEDTVFKHADCAGSRSYYIDRHGDAALPLPRTPWWRWWRIRGAQTEGFEFT